MNGEPVSQEGVYDRSVIKANGVKKSTNRVLLGRGKKKVLAKKNFSVTNKFGNWSC